jgi:excisionase family DNA binding protein
MPGMLLTLKEAAEYLGIGQKAMRNLVQSGKIAFARPGKQKRYTVSALEAYLRSNQSRLEPVSARAVRAKGGRSHDGAGEAGGFIAGAARRAAERAARRQRGA